MKNKKKVFMWTQRDGTKIAVTKMTNSHLANAISLMARSSEMYRSAAINAGYQMLGFLHGEQAIYAVEAELSRLEDGKFDLYDESEAYRALIDEEERRRTR